MDSTRHSLGKLLLEYFGIDITTEKTAADFASAYRACSLDSRAVAIDKVGDWFKKRMDCNSLKDIVFGLESIGSLKSLFPVELFDAFEHSIIAKNSDITTKLLDMAPNNTNFSLILLSCVSLNKRFDLVDKICSRHDPQAENIDYPVRDHIANDIGLVYGIYINTLQSTE